MERYMMALRNRHCSTAISRARIILMSMLFGVALDGGSVLADAAKAETPTALIEVKVREGLLTFNARGAPLADVLRAIGEKADFTVIIRGNLSTPVTRSLSDIPLEKAISRLVGENTWLMIYRPSDSERQASAPLRLQVYAKRTRDTGTAAVGQPTDIKSDTTDPVSILKNFKGSISGSIARDLAQRARSPGQWNSGAQTHSD